MALEQFRPKIWSDRLIIDVDRALVFRAIASTEYEGEISGAGDVVKISQLGAINISTYSEDTDITYQILDDAQLELVINKKKYFAFGIDDVAQAQSRPDVMSGAMQLAAHGIGKEIDEFLAGKYTEAGVPTTNLGTNLTTHQDVYAVSGGSDGILGVITNMELSLNEADVPNVGRFVVWPSWGAAYLKQAGITDNIAGNAQPGLAPSGSVGPGYLGNFLGFDHYVSNSVSNNGTAYAVMFGGMGALAYAGQVARVESLRLQDHFKDAVRGLYVYGAKVVRPDRLGVAYLDPVGLSS